jgi:hypothetical protein
MRKQWDAFRDRSHDWLHTVVARSRWGNITKQHLTVVLLGLSCVGYSYLTTGDWLYALVIGGLGYILIAMVIFWF